MPPEKIPRKGTRLAIANRAVGHKVQNNPHTHTEGFVAQHSPYRWRPPSINLMRRKEESTFPVSRRTWDSALEQNERDRTV